MAGEYLFKDYPKINQTLDRLVALYGAHDGRPPPVFPPGFPPAGVPMPTGNFSFTRWYWAAKHALADAELFCPAQMAARQFTRRNVSAFQFQWRHTPLEVTCTAAPCNAAGAPHSSDLAFWFSIRDGQNSVRSVEELTLARRMTEYLGHIAATCEPPRSHCHLGCILLNTAVVSLLAGGGPHGRRSGRRGTRGSNRCWC